MNTCPIDGAASDDAAVKVAADMMETSNQDAAKKALRADVRQRLEAIDPETRQKLSGEACRRLAGLEAFRHAMTVMMYMPLATEVDTTPLAIRCFQTGKTVCVPKVDWRRREMTALEVNSIDDHVMETDEHGLRSPRTGRPIVPRTIDLIIVPAIAYDTDGHRLGRGGGFYDRFLTRLRRSTTKIGFAFDEQIVEQVPVDAHDMRVDFVVTDRRITRRGCSHSRQ